jgi:hypothetical protein
MTYLAAPDRYEHLPCGRSGIELPGVSPGLRFEDQADPRLGSWLRACLTSVAASAQELLDHSGDSIEQIAASWCRVKIPHVCVGAGSAARMTMMIVAFCYVTYTES